MKTPPNVSSPEVLMRSSRGASSVANAPSSLDGTPKSADKNKSMHEESLEASERAAKKPKIYPPCAIGELSYLY